EAGQHLMVGAEVNGRCVYRSYSCSDVTGRPDLLEITVKQVNGGKLSHWLCQHARVGDVLQLQQPFGELVWPSTSQSVILLAAGSGITPLISLLRQHVQQSHHQHTNNQAIELHYWVSRAEQACFTEELNALTTILPNFKFYLYVT
ncbi:FAD-binding oxidoreductase, partial [Rhizobium hidalgonense]